MKLEQVLRTNGDHTQYIETTAKFESRCPRACTMLLRPVLDAVLHMSRIQRCRTRESEEFLSYVFNIFNAAHVK